MVFARQIIWRSSKSNSITKEIIRRNSMGKLGNIILAAAGGFIAGVLLAPKSGKETREDIKQKATEYKGKAQDGLKEVKKGAHSVKGELAEGAQSARGIAKDTAEDLKQAANRVKEEATKRSQSIREDVNRTIEETKRSTR
jgi:gas vesicle protein